MLLDSLYSDVTGCFSGSAYLSFVALHSSSKYTITVDGFMGGQALKGRMALQDGKLYYKNYEESTLPRTSVRVYHPGKRWSVCVSRKVLGVRERRERRNAKSESQSQRTLPDTRHAPILDVFPWEILLSPFGSALHAGPLHSRVLFCSSHIYAWWHRFLRTQWSTRGSLFTKCLFSARR